MYFDFEDYRPETQTVPRAISAREGVLLSIILHLLVAIAILVTPELPFVRAAAEQAERERSAARELALQRQREAQRFVFIAPRVEQPAPSPPPDAALSDMHRQARAPERAPKPTNRMPFARGNSPEWVESPRAAQAPRAPEPSSPPPAAGSAGGAQPRVPLPDAPSGALAYETDTNPAVQQTPGDADDAGTKGGTGNLRESLQNLQKFVQGDSFHNPGGGGGQFGPIEFDSKGVEFGPWIRRFIAQVRRNWFIPYAAMAMKGHVVVTFNVHKSGAITDLAVLRPSGVEAFNRSAFNALASSNPTQPLPPEYPDSRAFFTVTFYYNETPPSSTQQ
jgi:TonB family protein